ncbi:MAG: sulfotransferase family 2 domain-containing protein [Bacteroidota bacterium]
MIELLSIHIPKTAGTSFYQILQQVYGQALSISFKRRDYKALVQKYGRLENGISHDLRVLHGHFYYQELQDFQQSHQIPTICWLRDPVQRVVSNYRFFKQGLRNPLRNPRNYEINKHRVEESLLTYAAIPENQNRMVSFLEGISLEELFFVGIQEHFKEDVQRLAQLLDWPKVQIPYLNRSESDHSLPEAIPADWLAKIRSWNAADVRLYEAAMALRLSHQKSS